MAMVVAIGWALFAEQLSPRVRTFRNVDDEDGASLQWTQYRH